MEDTDIKDGATTPEVKSKPIQRRRKRSPNKKPTKSDLSAMPLPLVGTEKPRVAQVEIPRLSHWVCRDDECFWARADHGGCLYKKGDVITVDFAPHEQPHRFDYARGWWYPEGAKVVDLQTMRCIPQQFEPFHPDGNAATLDLWEALLVDPLKINYARANVQVGTKGNPFKFKEEAEDRLVEVTKLDLPKPISPESLKNPKEAPEKFNPSDLAAKGGFH